MRKRGAQHSRVRGHILTPQQVQKLVTPIHVALELLPLGLYTEAHAHDLAAFLTIAQVAAKEAGRDDIVKAGAAGADVLIAMKNRAKAGKSWNVTVDERDALLRSITALDQWQRTQTTTRWARAMHKVIAMCERAEASGAQPFDLMVEAA